MRSHQGRHRTAVPRIGTHPRPQRGFSLIELLVTIVIAAIFFAAMVPFFANALKASSRDQARNVAANIALDRIEQIRLLKYQSVTQANLTAPPTPFGDNKFGTAYPVASGTAYNVNYSVSPSASPDATQKTVTVSVSKPGASYTTTMKTVIKNSAPGVQTAVSTAPSPSPTITGLSITVYFKDWSDVSGTNQGVSFSRTGGTPTTSPTLRPISSATPYVTWTGLTGGTAFTYTVKCVGAHVTSTSPQFRLLKNARLKFDTNPGN